MPLLNMMSLPSTNNSYIPCRQSQRKVEDGQKKDQEIQKPALRRHESIEVDRRMAKLVLDSLLWKRRQKRRQKRMQNMKKTKTVSPKKLKF